jgi:toxin CcdB
MARYDVYANLNPRLRADIPFLLDVQADLFRDLGSRVVVPLYKDAIPRPIAGLQPRLTVDGVAVVMDTPALAAVPVRSLGERIGNLGNEGPTILRALDLLLTGA